MSRLPLLVWRRRPGGGDWLLATAFLLFTGCNAGLHDWISAEGDVPQHPPVILDADTGFTPTQTAAAGTAKRPLPAQVDARLHVLHVQVPRTARRRVVRLWDSLREDTLDSETVWRLHRNGIRVGVGRTERWEEIQAVLDHIGQNRVHEFPALRTLPGVPLALELDRAPQEQTIFYIDRDGIVSGDTWPESQKALRVTCTLDTRDADRVFLSVVPEIRQQLGRAVSYDQQTGWTAEPRRRGRAFATATFAVALKPNEFVLLAPGEKADLFGIVGGAFLTDEVAGQPYDSYVFVRAEVAYARQHH